MSEAPDPRAAMREMSRAIREVLERYAPTLKELDEPVLADFTQIVSAFALDLREELERRRTP